MILDDIYNEQISRYEFASRFSSGLVLDYTYGSLTSYHCSKILLDNGSKEVYSYDMLSDQELSHRMYGLNNEVEFNLVKKDSLKDSFFDYIISSETIQHENNPEYIINYFHNLLKENKFGI